MKYKSINPIYLVQFTAGSPLVLLKYFELDEFVEQWKYVDFVVKFKEGIEFNIKKCDDRFGEFGNKYQHAVNFNHILTVDNIERFKLSPSLNNTESHLKQIYDGKNFDMSKLNDNILISSNFANDGDFFSQQESEIISKAISKKKIPRCVWILILLAFVIIAYFYYENYIRIK
jgi:hypothetical protein